MGRKFWIAAILIPIFCYFMVKYQDADFMLMVYEMIGQDPATALRGKVVWITGASSGIGEYLAYELAKYGCKLVLSARRKAELERVKENCAAIATGLNSSFQKEQDILVLPLDLVKHDTHDNLTQDVIRHFGKVDILVNNGGRFQKSWMRRTPLEVDSAIFDLNVIGTISLTKAVLPYMIERKEGKIVVVSSVLGKMGKFCLNGYFDGVRMELAQYNIHVQTVLPGPVASQVTDKAFTEDINIEYKDSPGFIKVDFPVMPTERCAKLMVIGMANNLDEVWISENPMLLATYMKQYF
ncbi:dehydrogenase/reductase SDR family member 7-like, partial [Stylophora pistillata]|uniref:dehydrogenase/reductase SDR family member 7-like n=1 Tax=Stylophora pistillata TaxID=50429 RepID=UPI000C04A1CE